LKKNLQNPEAADPNIDKMVVLLRGAAERLAPDAEFRVVLTNAEATMRSHASESEAGLDPDIRKTADYFQQRVMEIAATKRAAEEARTRLWAHTDRLLIMKERLKLNRAVAEVVEFAKGAQAYLDEMRIMAARAQRLAINLDNFRRPTPTQ